MENRSTRHLYSTSWTQGLAEACNQGSGLLFLSRVVAALVMVGLVSCNSEEIQRALEPCAQPALTSWEGGQLSYERADCGTVQLEGRVLGSGSWQLSMEETDDGAWMPVVTSESGGVFEGLVLEGTWSTTGSDEPVLWRQGYQSWSYSGVVPLEALTLDDAGVPEVGGDGDATAVIRETEGTSWWVGLVGQSDGSSLLMGARGLTRTRFFVAFDSERVWAVWGHRGEQIEVAAGEELRLDPLWLSVGADPWQLHLDYADQVTASQATRPLPSQPPTGWATWYQYFEDITETDVRANLQQAAALQNQGDTAPIEVFQIDDGWQRKWGDWEADDGFPSGMEALADDIAAAGFVPGLWMAPMYVDRSTTTYLNNPDWWVRSRDGEELQFTNLDTGDYAVLDVSHPDAQEWLRALIDAKVREGWTYLKLDFLYAAAQEGLRQEPLTGVEAYHLAMGVMREAAGDAWLLACGAPMLPSVGYADSYRSGADIAFGFDRRPERAYMRWQARATAARGWANGLWWWNDPDQLLVREPLTEVGVAGSLAATVVSGGTWMLGDDLVALPPERRELALLSSLTDLRGGQWTPQSPLQFVSGLDAGPVIELITGDDRVPTRWDLGDEATVLLNLGDEPVVVGSPGGTELISGLVAGPGDRTLPAGSGEVWVP